MTFFLRRFYAPLRLKSERFAVDNHGISGALVFIELAYCNFGILTLDTYFIYFFFSANFLCKFPTRYERVCWISWLRLSGNDQDNDYLDMSDRLIVREGINYFSFFDWQLLSKRLVDAREMFFFSSTRKQLQALILPHHVLIHYLEFGSI